MAVERANDRIVWASDVWDRDGIAVEISRDGKLVKEEIEWKFIDDA